MSIRNKSVKALGFLFVYLFAFVQAYLIALLWTNTIASVICMVWSFIQPLPAYIGAHYGVLVLQGAVPISLFFLIYILRNIRKQAVKPKKEQRQQ